MKTLFELMQRWTIELCVLLGFSPLYPQFFQRYFGLESDVPAYTTMFVLAVSVILIMLLLWFLLDKWYIQRPWRLSAVGCVSLVAFMTSSTGLGAMYGIMPPNWHFIVSGVPSHLFLFVMSVFLFLDWQDKKQFGENNRTS